EVHRVGVAVRRGWGALRGGSVVLRGVSVQVRRRGVVLRGVGVAARGSGVVVRLAERVRRGSGVAGHKFYFRQPTWRRLLTPSHGLENGAGAFPRATVGVADGAAQVPPPRRGRRNEPDRTQSP